MAKAIDNGVTEKELVEPITHVTFYSGWPTGISAIALANKAFEKKGL
nr:carboxymuconolactone decarboxylase family protein [Sphingomonas sp. CDS-1]